MGIALSIEPLCHFDCFDDNQRIAGVIPLQLGINFPVDLLGFRRQLFSLFGAGDEQIAMMRFIRIVTFSNRCVSEIRMR